MQPPHDRPAAEGRLQAVHEHQDEPALLRRRASRRRRSGSTSTRTREGTKSYSKTKPIRIEEFAPEKKWWGKRKENDQAWKVSVEDIKARGYNLDIKNPHSTADETVDPVELLAEFSRAEEQLSFTRDQLKKMLVEALQR